MGWRQNKNLLRKTYNAFQSARKGRKHIYRKGYVQAYLDRCNKIRLKAVRLLDLIKAKRLEIIARQTSGKCLKKDAELLEDLKRAKHEISLFVDYLVMFSDQITRRILGGQTIEHAEKAFSIFKPFTRWIVKGKVGILQELGVAVAVVEDEHQFILGHGVLWNGTDKDIAVELIKEVQERFPEFKVTCWFDRSFDSPAVREELDTMLEVTAMPSKGNPTKAEQERQSTPEYKKARKGHSAVESCMNNLNHRRMDVVREVKPEAVALSVLSANIHRLGTIIVEQARKQRQQYRRAA